MTDATKLPPLPEPEWMLWCQHAYEDPHYSCMDGYTEEQMLSHAEAARAPLLAEIEALRKRAEDAERDAARYRAFFERGPVVCFDGREFVNKGECDSAIDAAIKGGAA